MGIVDRHMDEEIHRGKGNTIKKFNYKTTVKCSFCSYCHLFYKLFMIYKFIAWKRFWKSTSSSITQTTSKRCKFWSNRINWSSADRLAKAKLQDCKTSRWFSLLIQHLLDDHHNIAVIISKKETKTFASNVKSKMNCGEVSPQYWAKVLLPHHKVSPFYHRIVTPQSDFHVISIDQAP